MFDDDDFDLAEYVHDQDSDWPMNLDEFEPEDDDDDI